MTKVGESALKLEDQADGAANKGGAAENRAGKPRAVKMHAACGMAKAAGGADEKRKGDAEHASTTERKPLVERESHAAAKAGKGRLGVECKLRFVSIFNAAFALGGLLLLLLGFAAQSIRPLTHGSIVLEPTATRGDVLGYSKVAEQEGTLRTGIVPEKGNVSKVHNTTRAEQTVAKNASARDVGSQKLSQASSCRNEVAHLHFRMLPRRPAPENGQ